MIISCSKPMRKIALKTTFYFPGPLTFYFFKYPLLTIRFFFTANGLRCNNCTSNNSWGDCDSNITKTDCTGMDDASCVKFSYEVTRSSSNQQQNFGRGCLPQSQCSSSLFPACKRLAQDAKIDDKLKMTCHVSCCGEDLCNSQVKLNSSRVLFLVIPLFAYVSFGFGCI